MTFIVSANFEDTVHGIKNYPVAWSVVYSIYTNKAQH